MFKRLAFAGALALACSPSHAQNQVNATTVGGYGSNGYLADGKSPFLANGASSPISSATRSGWTLTPQDFGAKGDAQVVTPVAVTAAASSSSVTFTGTSFTAADIGKNIVIPGIGTSGAPLATTIAGVSSATAVTLGANAVTAQTALSTVIYYGHDDSAAFNALFSAIPAGSTVFVPKSNYLIASTITLPSFFTAANIEDGAGVLITGAGQGATQIVAGGAGMTSIFVEPQTWHKAARFEHLTLDGAGIVAQTYWLASGYKGGGFDAAFLNGASQDLLIGTGTTNAQDNRYTDVYLNNDSAIFVGGYPAYNLNAQGSDNVYTNINAAHAATSNFYDWGAGDQYVNTHGWGGGLHAYQLKYMTSCTGCEVDGSTASGVQFNGWNNTWTGGFVQNLSAGAYAFEFATTEQFNIINNPNLNGVNPNYYILNSTGSRQYNNSVMIPGFVLSWNASAPGMLTATTTSTSAVTMTLNNAAPTVANLPYLNAYGLYTVNGTLVAKDSAGNIGTWTCSLVIRTTAPANAPTIITQSVVAGSGNTLVPTTAPVFAAPAAGTLSYYLNVSGATTNATNWSFTPTYGGV